MRVLVIGAGIAGLAAAHAVRREAARRGINAEVQVLEASARSGGRVATIEEDGWLVEWAANGIQGIEPTAAPLLESLGLTAERVLARPESARRYVYRGGRLHLLPLSPPALLRFGGISPGARLRVFAEPFFATRHDKDETVHDFAVRHVGAEAATALVGTAVRGIFGGDARKLSLEAAFPVMREMERKHRSLVVAMIRGKRTPGGRALWTMRRGLEQLVRGLSDSLETAVRVGAPVLSLERRGEGSRAGWAAGLASGEKVEADAVIVAVPVSRAAALLRPLDRDLARALGSIPSASLGVVALGFRPEAFRRPPDGYGFLVAPGEPLEILGALCESNLWPGRAPEGRVLIRVMIGGSERPDLLTRSDADLTGLAMGALDRAWGLVSGPERTWVMRHPDAIPQYPVGHRARLGAIAGRLDLFPGLHLAGNGYRGVSVAALLEDAPRVAERVVERSA
ncbi:MAG TPA: protoporphyrinogen oxidase [Candidatus Eisenbacteria bacterium]|nr:protoporphyrinogen oxidase [Candidatus Eisenbacteria bacterium]